MRLRLPRGRLRGRPSPPRFGTRGSWRLLRRIKAPGRTTGAPADRRGPRLGLRLSVVTVVVVGLFAVMLLRLWSIQVIGAPAARSRALQTVTVDVPVQPPRGSIDARGGQPFAEDVAEEVVTLSCPSSDRQFCPSQDRAVIERLAPLVGKSVAEIDAEVQSNQIGPFVPAPVAVGVPYSTVAYLAEHASEFPGVSVEETYVRAYPQHALASQVIGYVGSITAPEYARFSAPRYASYGYTEQDTQFGQSGLEQQYELALHGKPGVSRVEVSPTGAEVGTLSSTPPTPGDTVVLNLDAGLERAVTSDLASHIAALRAGTVPGSGGPVPAPWGAAVVIDPRNGHVLAMASYPGYDDNLWVPAISEKAYRELTPPPSDPQPLIDYAVEDGNPPGSVFKLATATAVLQDGIITPQTIIDDTGTFTLGTTVLHDAAGEVLGPVDVTQAITESSDVFFYTMGEWAWNDRARFGMTIQKTAAAYGLGVPSGIDLPNVSPGQVDSPQLRELLHAEDPQAYPSAAYYPGDNVEMAFGQGETLLTPLEVANAYATFANGGTRYAPEMAAALVSPEGRVQRIKPRVMDHVAISPANYQAMLQGFEGAVQQPNGTAYGSWVGFNFSKWLVAGKTGTATITHTSQPTAWFACFGGPKGQPPRYAVAVEVNQAGYGANGAAPVARAIFDYLYSHGVAPLRLH